MGTWLTYRRDAAIDSVISDVTGRLLTLASIVAIYLLVVLPPYILAVLVGVTIVTLRLQATKKTPRLRAGL